MPDLTPRGVPYALPDDPLRSWPGVSQQLAEVVDGLAGRTPSVLGWVLPSRVTRGDSALITLGSLTVPGPGVIVIAAQVRVGASTATAAQVLVQVDSSTACPWWGNPAANAGPNLGLSLAATVALGAGSHTVALQAAGQDGKTFVIEPTQTRLQVLYLPS